MRASYLRFIRTQIIRLSYDDMADAIGVSSDDIYRYERGADIPDEVVRAISTMYSDGIHPHVRAYAYIARLMLAAINDLSDHDLLNIASGSHTLAYTGYDRAVHCIAGYERDNRMDAYYIVIYPWGLPSDDYDRVCSTYDLDEIDIDDYPAQIISELADSERYNLRRYVSDDLPRELDEIFYQYDIFVEQSYTYVERAGSGTITHYHGVPSDDAPNPFYFGPYPVV